MTMRTRHGISQSYCQLSGPKAGRSKEKQKPLRLISLTLVPFLEAAALLPRLFPFCGSLAVALPEVPGGTRWPCLVHPAIGLPGPGVAQFGDHIRHDGSCSTYATLEISGNRLTGEILSWHMGRSCTNRTPRYEIFRWWWLDGHFLYWVPASQRGCCWFCGST